MTQNMRNVVATVSLWFTLGCQTLDCQVDACDIRSTDCQRAIMESTACLRDREPESVPMRIISRSEFVREALETEENVQEQDARFAMQRAYALFGLEDANESYADAVRSYTGTVGGYYDSKEDEIVLIDTGYQLDTLQHASMLAHEYAHALQWRHSPPDRTQLNTLDEWLAAIATTEGDASWTEDRLYSLGAGRDPQDIDWAHIHQRWRHDAEFRYSLQPSRVRLASRYFVYAFGARYAKHLFDQGGQAALDDAITSPPSSSLEILRLQSIDFTDSFAALAKKAVPEIAGAQLLTTDRIGWWVLSRGSDLGLALEAAGHRLTKFNWRGDSVSLWARDDGEPLFALRMVFRRTRDAEEIAAALKAFDRDDSFIVRVDERAVELLLTHDSEWLAQLRDVPPIWSPVPEQSQAEDANDSHFWQSDARNATLSCLLHPDH